MLLLFMLASGDSPAAFAAVLCSSALLVLLLTARSVYSRDYGAAVAWGYIALAGLALVSLLELSLAQTSRVLGIAGCDPAFGCSLPAAPYWIPLLLTLASGFVTITVLRRSKRVQDEAPTA